jgi:hypothetical protein
MIFFYCAAASAQGPQGLNLGQTEPFHYQKKSSVTPGNEFGEQIDLEGGSLSFAVTDIDVPGQNNLSVSLRRKHDPMVGMALRENLSMADWRIDLPTIYGDYSAAAGWKTTDTNRPDKNCSIASQSYVSPPPILNFFAAHEYWGEPTLYIPGESNSRLQYNANKYRSPTSGGKYYWLTKDMAYVSCIPALKNKSTVVKYGGYEGYTVKTRNGTTYTFDWIGATALPTVFKSRYYAPGRTQTESVQMVRLSFYPTKITDRFGNWVAYTYTNPSDKEVRLSRITSSDGRSIALTYRADGLIEKVVANGKTWTYSYQTVNSRPLLSRVNNPDKSSWQYGLADLMMFEYPLHSSYRTCESAGSPYPGVKSGYVISPSGARADFSVSARKMGRSGVPKSCYPSGVLIIGGNVHVTSASMNVMDFGSWALSRKRVSGLGLPTRDWVYSYESTYGFLPFTNGYNSTTIRSPDGAAVKYKYGNTFQKDEGLLLNVTHLSGSSVLRQVSFAYNQSRQIGFENQYRGLGYSDAYVRPTRTRSISQDGEVFTYKVNLFDSFDRPTNVTRLSTVSSSLARTEVTTYHDALDIWR